MHTHYTIGFKQYRCPDCLANWSGDGQLRSYDPETDEDKLIKDVPAEEHPQNGCWRAPQPEPTPERAYVYMGSVFFGGRVVCDADEPATNGFGYSHEGYTWESVARLGVPIWMDSSQLWCEDPETYPQLFVMSMQNHGETFRRIVLDPNPETAEECEYVARFWSDRCRAEVSSEGRMVITVRL